MKYFLYFFKNVVFLIFFCCLISEVSQAQENKPPVVSLTAAKKDTVISGTSYNNVVLTAVATDTDGSIVKVDFYSGQVFLGSSTTSPFIYKWTKVPTGTFTLTAKATDDAGAVSISNAIIMAVNNNKLPSVSIVAPLSNQIFNEGNPFWIDAKATDSDGTIKRAELYKNEILIATWNENYTNMYNFYFVPDAGIFVFTIKVFDDLGGVAVSSPVTIEVRANKAPTINVNSPINNSFFYAPAEIEFEIDANDEDGSVKRVNIVWRETEQNSKLIAELTSSPFKFTWKDVKAGNYKIFVAATDDKDRVTWSKEINITAVVPQAPFKGNPWSIPGLIEAENYDTGGEGVAYHNADMFWNNIYRKQDQVDVERHGDYIGGGVYEGYHIAYVSKGEWLKYTVNVLNTGIYDFIVSGSYDGFQAPGEKFMHVEINDVDVTGPVLIPDTKDWNKFQTVKIPGVFLTEGLQIMKVVFDSNELNLDYVEITPSDVVTGLSNHSSGNSLSIFPNPATDFFNLKVNEDIRSISVLNLLGQNVYAEANLTKGSELAIGNEFERGAYVVNVIYASGARETFRLIKVR